MSKKQYKIIFISSFIFLVVFFIFIFNKTTILTNSANTTVQPVNLIKAVLEINDKQYESIINESINIYDFMKQLRLDGKFTFKEKNYIGMGQFIQEINGVKNNGDKNWIYYVNGKKAEIGVSDYKLTSGDIVSWKYEENIY
jgi:hypothetical protein